MNNNVYINRLLNMRKIQYIGLDMDHTLVRYDSEAFECLVFQLVIEGLVKQRGYPIEIRNFKFHYQDAIRGLVIDKKNGNIIKLSRFGAIRLSYHGTRQMSYEEQKKLYHSVYVDLNNPQYVPIDTSFSIAYCVLFAALVDLKDQKPDCLPEYDQMNDDVRNMVDLIHADGSLKGEVSKDLARFVIRERRLVDGLKQYIAHGKKFFILTNSDYYYTRSLLDFAIGPFLEKGEHWLDLFEYVIVLANKPRFFYDNVKFLSVDKTTGLMSNTYGPMQSGIYQGGNATTFADELGLSGDEILYIGDHIYGDIVRLKKDCNWRTALVVEELGHEVAAVRATRTIEQKIQAIMEQKKELEKQALLCNVPERKAEKEQILRQMTHLDNTLSELIQTMEAVFNPKWGQLFRTGAESSFFAYQIERFSCIYMEKISDFLALSPLSYFRAHQRYLPHEQHT
ncbi:MAG: HAD-IG family 5'-nucleotidase [Legionellaceae bacterium]|nr:HAD-IG family 5'-nucleotidase [Legionellaceae bacterium]